MIREIFVFFGVQLVLFFHESILTFVKEYLCRIVTLTYVVLFDSS